MLCGTHAELLEHFCRLTDIVNQHMKIENLLYSKDGIKKQLDDLIKDRNGIGTIFYLTTMKKSKHEANFELKHALVSIETV